MGRYGGVGTAVQDASGWGSDGGLQVLDFQHGDGVDASAIATCGRLR